MALWTNEYYHASFKMFCGSKLSSDFLSSSSSSTSSSSSSSSSTSSSSSSSVFPVISLGFTIFGEIFAYVTVF